MSKNVLLSVVTTIFTLGAMLGVGEAVIRLKNSSMKNYDIEMWRYSKDLKTADADLGHNHIKNSSALLQSVTIRTNKFGLRGGPVTEGEYDRRILFLGASIALGWGVPEDKTVTALTEKYLTDKGQKVQVLNAGIGNYNAERYVERFFRDLQALKPTDIVVHYFLRDAEKLEAGGGNWFLRNSQLAVTMWIAASRTFNLSGTKRLLEHYQDVYKEDQPGYIAMVQGLNKLKQYADKNKIRVYLAMTPDVHDLKNYQFTFIHDRMRKLSTELGFRYVDLLPALSGLDPKELWAMAGDPHPNSLGHRLMAETLLPVLAPSE